MSPASGSGVRAGHASSLIRARRREVGLTQHQLAEAVGVSRQTVISMESGDYAPSVYLAVAVARQLDTTVESLWGADVPLATPTT